MIHTCKTVYSCNCDRVRTEWIGDFEVHYKLRAHRDRIAKEKSEDVANQELVRLSGLITGPEPVLLLEKTSWYDFVATNRSLNFPIPELEGKTIKEYYGRAFRDVLANPITVSAVLLTCDGYAIIKKSESGKFGIISAGFMKPGDRTPFETMQRSHPDITDLKLIEICTDIDEHYEFIFKGIVNSDREKMQKREKKLYFIRFHPHDVMHSLINRDWIPTHSHAMYRALETSYGEL